MEYFNNLFGTKNRSSFLVGGHAIAAISGLVFYTGLVVFAIICFFIVKTPAQLYPVPLFFFQLLAVICSLIVLLLAVSDTRSFIMNAFFSMLGLGAYALLSTAELIIAYIYIATFSADCAFRQGNLTTGEYAICVAGDNPAFGQLIPFILLIFNIVLTLHMILGAVTMFFDALWVLRNRGYLDRGLPFRTPPSLASGLPP